MFASGNLLKIHMPDIFYQFEYFNVSEQKKDILVIGSFKYRKKVWKQSHMMGKYKDN